MRDVVLDAAHVGCMRCIKCHASIRALRCVRMLFFSGNVYKCCDAWIGEWRDYGTISVGLNGVRIHLRCDFLNIYTIVILNTLVIMHTCTRIYPCIPKSSCTLTDSLLHCERTIRTPWRLFASRPYRGFPARLGYFMITSHENLPCHVLQTHRCHRATFGKHLGRILLV